MKNTLKMFKGIRKRFQALFGEDRIVIFMKLLLISTILTEKLIFVSLGRYIIALINLLFWPCYCYELLWKICSFQSPIITCSWRSVEFAWTHRTIDWVRDTTKLCRANKEKPVAGITLRKWVLVGETRYLNLYLHLFKRLFGHLGINNFVTSNTLS